MKLYLSGGGERWALDFINVLKRNGYDVDIYQFSKEPKTIKFKGLTVNGIGNVQLADYGQCMRIGLQTFRDMTEKHDCVFLLSMNLCQGLFKQPVITVSHGLWFDGYESPINHGANMMDMMKSWIRNSTECISVDTNSIHAMQLYAPKIGHKMTYIPNYVDLNIFKPDEKDYNGKFKVLFPRRIDKPRGYIEMVEAIKILNEKYKDDMEFTFCGRGQEPDEKELHGMIDGIDNVKHISYETEDMPKAYKGMHISCIPTIRAEGTSLSCLESIATGTVPIVTTVGGLTDIVFKNVNGIVIPPKNSKELAKAIEHLYLHKKRLQEMKEMGLKIINGFSKERWEKEVVEIVKRVYGE
jgi:glycosyltransferase involved in cell wall biosynthesis